MQSSLTNEAPNRRLLVEQNKGRAQAKSTLRTITGNSEELKSQLSAFVAWLSVLGYRLALDAVRGLCGEFRQRSANDPKRGGMKPES
jgi:hypothetical protein